VRAAGGQGLGRSLALPNSDPHLRGAVLRDRGRAERACRHLERALRSTSSHRFLRAIAADQLRRLGVDIQAIGAGPATEDPEVRR
jgi:hypothetical protein